MTTVTNLYSRPSSSLLAAFRAGEWWEHKLAPIFAIFYATSFLLYAPLAAQWTSLVLLLFALMPGAVFVSVINDLTDRQDDLAAGKLNRMMGQSRWTVATLVAIPIALGLGVMFWWRSDPVLLTIYGAAWASFSLYSLPPLRLKTRGFAGVLADACGAHVFVSVLAAVLAFRAAGRSIDPLWIGTVTFWSLAYGMRGILWHQLRDRENDRIAGTRTFAQHHAPEAISRFAKRVIFPIEFVSLLLLLWQLDSIWPWLSLSIYAVMMIGKVRWFGTQPVIVETRPNFVIVLHDYYVVFFPIAVLFASSLRSSGDFAVLAFHLITFPRRCLAVAGDCYKLLLHTIHSFFQKRYSRA